MASLKDTIRSIVDSLKTLCAIYNSRGKLSVGRGVYINLRSIVKSKTTIGDHTRINGKICIKGSDSVIIGKYCAIGADVKIISDTHIAIRAAIQATFYEKFFGENLIEKKGEVIVGNDVWIGDSAILLPGVKIGDGAIVGAGAVVTKDIPSYAVMGGVPAKLIKERFSPDVQRQLLEIRWWDWSEEKIRANRDFFLLDIEKSASTDLFKLIK